MLAGFALPAFPAEKPALPGYVIPRSEVRTLPVNAAGRQYAPEFIVVGMGHGGENPDFNNLRRWELTPVPFGTPPERSGHAKDYLETIEKVFIPLIDEEYRTDPKMRVLGGE